MKKKKRNTCSAVELCLTLCDHMDCGTPIFPVSHYLQEFVSNIGSKVEYFGGQE